MKQKKIEGVDVPELVLAGEAFHFKERAALLRCLLEILQV